MSPNPHTLRYFSLLCLLSSAHAFYQGFYDFAILLLMQCIASYKYWNDPENNLLRNIDRVVTIINVIYFSSFYIPSLYFILPITSLSYYEKYTNNNTKKADEIWMILHIVIFLNVNFIIWKKKNYL